MTPLIDADILRYEIGALGQYEDDEGELVYKNFDEVSRHLDEKIEEICAEVWATEPPIIFLSNDIRLHKRKVRKAKKEGKPVPEYKPNFREKVAVKKEYKGNRKNTKKPFHYDNITTYLLANYKCKVAEGFEADDLMAIYQSERVKQGHYDTIICSRDKDLRQVEGMHFGWACGRQPQYGPCMVNHIGEVTHEGKKGCGLKFFYAQMIMGDGTDNIPGLPRCGPKKAYTLLYELDDERSIYESVAALYEDKIGEGWQDYMLEQGRLLWMCRELNEEGQPVMWEIPSYPEEEDWPSEERINNIARNGNEGLHYDC